MGVLVDRDTETTHVILFLPDGFELWLVDGDGSRTLLERIEL